MRLLKGVSLACIPVALLLSSALAGDDRGNGGDFMVCRNPDASIRSVELLDFYEARVIRGVAIDLGESNRPLEELVGEGISRIARLDSAMAGKLTGLAARFMDDADFQSGVYLEDVTDSGYVPVQRGCAVEQVAVRLNGPLPAGARRYVINRDLWDLADTVQKAGLVLHELIYGELRDLGALDSVAARRYNSTFASDRGRALQPKDYLRLLKGVAVIRRFVYGKVILDVQAVDIYPDGTPRKARSVAGTIAIRGRDHPILPTQTLEFREDGTLEFWRAASERDLIRLSPGYRGYLWIQFAPNGDVENYFRP